jgi:hypothetical protein
MELDGAGESSAHSYRMLVTRTEARTRKLTLDDAFRFAAALGVTPRALLYPGDEHERVAIVPRVHLAALLFEAWVDGPLPLRFEDAGIHGAHNKRGIGAGRLAMWVLGDDRDEGSQRPRFNDEEREALRAWVASARKKNEANIHDLAERGDIEGAEETREYLRGVEEELSEVERVLDKKEEK